MRNEEPAENFEAFAELNRKWEGNNHGPDVISFWVPGISYAICLVLMVGWTSGDLWVAKCGTPFMAQLSFCGLFGLSTLGAFLWAGFSRHNWSVATRFLVSGATPLVFPFVIGALAKV